MVQEAIIRDLQKQGYTLISAVEGPDLASDDPTRKLIRQVLGAIAEYDKSMTVQKLRAARDRKRAKTGRCEGRKPYGETEEEQKVLRRIRAMRRNRRGGHKGMTLQAIADRLNSEGISTKTRGDWSAAQVYHALNQKKRAGRSIPKNRI
jgi:DNA invertase Pin-like site-specific DNA recombinase